MARSRPTFSERRFHGWLARTTPASAASELPLGDDTSATPIGGGRVALLTTDALTEGTHFLRDSPPRAIGRAAANASLSDIASKGGTPVGLLLDLLLPPQTPESWARSVVEGARAAMRAHGGSLLGGDTKPSPHRSVVGTVLGIGRSDRLAPRNGARPGDLLVVTGQVGRGGWAARRLRTGSRPTGADLLALLAIHPRCEEGPILARWAHAMLDSSDGLAESVRLLSQASGVRISIDAPRLPLWSPLARSPPGPERLRTAFYGGDYELVATISPGDRGAAQRRVASVGCPLTVIGTVERGRGAWLRDAGAPRPLPRGGWDPFSAAR